MDTFHVCVKHYELNINVILSSSYIASGLILKPHRGKTRKKTTESIPNEGTSIDPYATQEGVLIGHRLGFRPFHDQCLFAQTRQFSIHNATSLASTRESHYVERGTVRQHRPHGSVKSGHHPSHWTCQHTSYPGIDTYSCDSPFRKWYEQ